MMFLDQHVECFGLIIFYMDFLMIMPIELKYHNMI